MFLLSYRKRLMQSFILLSFVVKRRRKGIASYSLHIVAMHLIVAWLVVMVRSGGLGSWLTIVLASELLVGGLAGLKLRVDFLCVVVENADAVASQDDEEEEVDADEHPHEIIHEIVASVPVHPVDRPRFAEFFSSLFHLVRNEAVPDEVTKEDNEADEVRHVEGLSRLMTILTDETRDEPDGKDGVNDDSEDVHLFGSEPQVEYTEHENNDDADDEWASAAAFVIFFVMFVDAHIYHSVCLIYI